MIPSYAKILQLGDPRIVDIFEGEVVVQEKYDASQISWQVKDGELHVRSKAAPLLPETADKLFKPAMEKIQQLFSDGQLVEGVIYRGEAFRGRRHNTLTYDRAPKGNILLYDMQNPDGMVTDPVFVQDTALLLGLEPCRLMTEIGEWSPDLMDQFLKEESSLGGVEVEGVVVKNYGKPNPMPHIYGPMMGKYVRGSFKELHKGEWKKANPSRSDVVDKIIADFNPPAVWEKAVIHLREKGELKGNPTDIGPLLKEMGIDQAGENEEYIKEVLFKHFWPKIQRGLSKGFADWYKERILHETYSTEA